MPQYPGNVTVTPDPVAAGASYHVDACGLQPNRDATIDTTGPGTPPYFTRDTYPVGAGRCAHYDAVAPTEPGEYLITVQQFNPNGPPIQPGAVKDIKTFRVQ